MPTAPSSLTKLGAASPAAAWLAGCTQQDDACFFPPSLVTTDRILAVRIDPPQLAVPQGETALVSVRVLAASGFGELRAAYAVSLCDASDDETCSHARVLFTTPELTGRESFQVPIDGDFVRAAIEADPLRGFGGTPARLFLSALTTGGTRLTASKRFIVTNDSIEAPINHGFEIDSLRIVRDTRAHHEVFSIPFEPDDRVVEADREFKIDRLDGYGLAPHLVADASGVDPVEVYSIVNLAGETVTLRERFTFSFFLGIPTSVNSVFAKLPDSESLPFLPYFNADIATVGDARSDTPILNLVSNEGGNGSLWVVGRDSRGAEAWARFFYFAVDATLHGKPQFKAPGRCALTQ